jgi:hypothetical protein
MAITTAEAVNHQVNHDHIRLHNIEIMTGTMNAIIVDPREIYGMCSTTELILDTGKVQSNEIRIPLFRESTVANLATHPIILHIQRPRLHQLVHDMVTPINLHRDQENVHPPVQQDGQVVPVL